MRGCTVCGHRNPPGTEYCEGPSCAAYLPHQRDAEPPVGIAVELAADAVSVSTGHDAECGVRVEDLGGRGGRVALEVVGELAAVTWPHPEELDLPARGHVDGRLTLRPSSEHLGRHLLRVRASLLTDPAVSAEDTAAVVVVDEPSSALTAMIPVPRPHRTRSPDRDGRRLASPGPRRWHPSRTTLLVLVALAVVGSAAGGLALLLSRDPPPDEGSGADELEPVPLAVPLVHDPPPGDGTENDGQLPRVVDQELSTAWVSEGYLQDHMNLKGGVGLFFRLPPGSAPRTVSVRSPSAGWGVRIYLTRSSDPGVPAPLAGRSPEAGSWGDPVAGATGITGGREFELPGSAATGALLWLQAGEEADGRYRIRVAEVQFLQQAGQP